MKKAKYKDVPKSYRRNYKKEFVEFLKIFAISFIAVAILSLMFWFA